MYLLRLDDAATYLDLDKWLRVESLLDRYDIRPLVAIIPNVADSSICSEYELEPTFWDVAKRWQTKGWSIALHGFSHKMADVGGGLNPVNLYSEFVGKPLEEQCDLLRQGVGCLTQNGITAEFFVAPAHTFDSNTLLALKTCTSIRTISDTVAWGVYMKDGIMFIPQQSGKVRWLPFSVTTFCYHPNTMGDRDFARLEQFLITHSQKFGRFEDARHLAQRERSIDKVLRLGYFSLRRFRRAFNLIR